MKNVLICNNCGKENAFFTLNCTKCNSFLRSKVANIDLWETIWKLFESPICTAETIIRSENKNFIITLLIFICCKFSINSMVIHNAFKNSNITSNFSQGLVCGGIPVILLLLVFVTVVTLLNKKFGIQNRFRDNLAIYTFSFTPQLFGLIILTPIQFALFGEYWFTFNPSPFIIKPMASVVLFIIEGLLFVWSGILFITSTFAQTKNKFYSVFVGSIFIFLTVGLLYFLS